MAANLQGEEMQRILSATALALAFTGSTDASAQLPTIEPSQVNAKNIGSCEIYDPNDPYIAGNALHPLGAIHAYVQYYQKSYITELTSKDYSVKYLEQPQHGTIKTISSETGTLDYYVPNVGYTGNDRYVAEVVVKGNRFRVAGYIRPSSDAMSGYSDLCRRLGLPGAAWKISDATDNSTGAAALADLDIQMAHMTGATLATTTGEGSTARITLNDNAAGHGWYIDPTPDTNEEFLPTSNPNEWVAKEGSEAAGKMDLLSVLLHEYGHVLGIEHSASAHDYMATTLQLGVRRMPSTEELALMAQLIGEAKQTPEDGSPGTPLNPGLPLGAPLGALLVGRLRLNRFGAWTPDIDRVEIPAPVTRFEVAANPKLQNEQFDGGAGWATQGDVSFANGAATLAETAATQTRLNQVFVVGEHDRYLSFTVAGIGLDDQMSGPDDAFEVGLLDANSGASLAGAIGLSHSDALLNLQADDSEFVGDNRV